MTLRSELIDIPTQVRESDVVISHATTVHEPERAVGDDVVTPQGGCQGLQSTAPAGTFPGEPTRGTDGRE